jgi:DNA-binding NarL/FixJ family response regulator
MIRAVIVDDQELVRSGFTMILDAQPDIDVVGEAADGHQAVQVSERLRPDVVLMDVRMPGLDGIQATERISRRPDPPRVLMLTTFDLDEYVYDAIRAGASGFLLKDVSRPELIHAVRTVAAGNTLLAPAITRRLVEQFVRRPPPGRRPERLQSLTNREQEILSYVGRGLSNAEIATELVLAETTVKTHVTRTLTKLGLRDRVQAVVLAYESGLIQPGE